MRLTQTNFYLLGLTAFLLAVLFTCIMYPPCDTFCSKMTQYERPAN